MAQSPMNDFMEIIVKFFGGVHIVDHVFKAFRGEPLDDKAPLAAKMAAGLMQSGDEVAQHLLLEALGQKQPHGKDDRERILLFLKWLRNRGGQENSISRIAAWYYFNGFRVKLTKMHGGQPLKDDDEDLGVAFLQRMADIIKKKPKEEAESTYEEVIEFLKISGVPVMPDLEFINKLKAWATSIPARLGAYDRSIQKRYEELGKRNGRRAWPIRQMLRLMGQPVTNNKKGGNGQGEQTTRRSPDDELNLHSSSVVLNIQSVQTININKEN